MGGTESTIVDPTNEQLKIRAIIKSKKYIINFNNRINILFKYLHRAVPYNRLLESKQINNNVDRINRTTLIVLWRLPKIDCNKNAKVV